MTCAKIALLGFFFGLIAPAYAATGDALELSDWQNANNPFAKTESVNGLSIASMLELDHQTGAHINAVWSCVKDGTELTIGLNKGDLDTSLKTGAFPVKMKLDNGPITTVSVTPDSARRFTIGKPLDPRVLFANDVMNIYKASYLYVGFPADGDDMALRISLHNGTVSHFLGSCMLALQTPSGKKVAQAEVKTVPVAADAAPAPVKQVVAEAAPAPPEVKTVQPDVLPKPAAVAASEPPDLAIMPPEQGLKVSRREEFARFNLRRGEQIILRREYVPETTPVRIGGLYSEIPAGDEDKIRKKIGDVGMDGNQTLKIIGIHRDKDRLDDWYYVQVNCAGCAVRPAGPGADEGWIAASDITAWRDDPLCVKGQRGCE